MSIRVGICGTGLFADHFIPLFKAHPDVENVVLCDLDAGKLRAKCEKFGISDSSPSLDDLCERDVDAIVIITQHHLHGPQAVLRGAGVKRAALDLTTLILKEATDPNHHHGTLPLLLEAA